MSNNVPLNQIVGDGQSPKLGPHHFAFLRSVAEGLSIIEAAKRFLAIQHGHEALPAYRRIVEVLRAIARRARQPGWRLIGIDLSQARQAANSTPTATQTLDDWAAARGLQDWSEAELLEMFQAEQASTRPDSNPQRRNRRINHLRDKQLTTLRALEAMACQKPHSADFISAWFDPLTAHRLQSIGLDLLGELRSTIDRGGRWYIALPAIGPQKAKRIEQLLDTLLPSQTTTLAILHDLTPDARAQLNVDRDVIKAWVEARSTSPATKKVYTREADRWQLWLSIERGKQQLREVNLADCKAYEDFLSNVPIEWQSRKKAQRFGPGWAPFSGLLSAQSQRQALTIVAALHEWLVAADYVPRNPWKLIRRPSPDKSAELMLDTRAFTPGQWQTLQQYVESQPPSPARDRILFTLRFGEATGLRPAELLGARLGDFKKIETGWVMQVVGKGARMGAVTVPSAAISALNDYLRSRAVPALPDAAPTLPVVAQTTDGTRPVSYSAFQESFVSWVKHAGVKSQKPLTLHSLRHTFGTRAVERGVPLDIVQAQMRHADPRTTARYSKAQLQRRQQALEEAFGKGQFSGASTPIL